MDWFVNRFKEASTWAGFPMIALGVSNIFGGGEVAQTAVNVTGAAAKAVEQTGDPWTGVAALVTGVILSLGKERGAPDRKD